MSRRAACVYVIKNHDSNYVKIGFSSDPNHRLKSLMRAGGCKMSLIYSTPYITNYNDLERLMHSNFADKRIVGEWFDISEVTATNKLKGYEITLTRPIQLHQKGMSIRKIAKITGVSPTGVTNEIKSYNQDFSINPDEGISTQPAAIKRTPPKIENSKLYGGKTLSELVEINKNKRNKN